jgi:glycosyltransferase involved in cell wall biosynthesis
LKLTCSAPDSGLYQAWNRGVVEARGDWVLFLGSDDYLLSSDALSLVAAAIRTSPGLEDFAFLYADTEAPHPQPDWSTYREKRLNHWLRGVTDYPTSVFIATRLFRQGYRFDESYRICADHKFFAQHDFFAHSAYIPVPLISFQNGGISSNTSLLKLHYRERRRMLYEIGRPRPFFTEWYYWLRSNF